MGQIPYEKIRSTVETILCSDREVDVKDRAIGLMAQDLLQTTRGGGGKYKIEDILMVYRVTHQVKLALDGAYETKQKLSEETDSRNLEDQVDQ